MNKKIKIKHFLKERIKSIRISTVVENACLGSAIMKQPGVDEDERDFGKMCCTGGVFKGNTRKTCF